MNSLRTYLSEMPQRIPELIRVLGVLAAILTALGIVATVAGGSSQASRQGAPATPTTTPAAEQTTVRETARPGFAPEPTKLEIPTHDGSGQVTHPSVVHIPRGWNGYEYWMAMTPYPSGKDSEEDPNIVASHDGDHWEVPRGVSNPLDDEPGGRGAYNSDTNLVLVDGTMYMTWRKVTENRKVEFYMRTSTDGANWTEPVLIATPTRNSLSQSLVRIGEVWRMYAVQTSTGENELVYWETTDLVPTPESWGATNPCGINSLGPDFEPWHIDIQHVNGSWYGLLTVSRWNQNGVDSRVHLMRSADGMNWLAVSEPIFPVAGGWYDSHYKSGFVVHPDGNKTRMDIYAAVVDSKTKARYVGRTEATLHN